MAAIDKHQLERLSRIAATTATIEGDRRCPGCQYNLKGLAITGRCPECGLPIHAPGAHDAPLSEMPRGMIVAFTRASWFATICVVLLVVHVASTYFVNAGPQFAASFLALSILWFIAVWLLTPAIGHAPAISRGFSRGGRLRIASRLLQLGWMQASMANLLLAALPKAKLTGSLADTLGVVQMAGVLIGSAGVLALCILLQRLAEWTRDLGAESAFNLSLWGVSATTVLLYVLPSFWIVTIVLFGIWAVAVCMFPYALLSLSRSLTWSIRHAGEYQDRLRRQRRRAEEYQEEVSSTIDRMDAT